MSRPTRSTIFPYTTLFRFNVLRGRRIAPQRVEEVAKHYEHFGGVSPITDLTMRQAQGLRERLAGAGHPLPVYVGMRNWHPLRSEEHTSELQSHSDLVCRLL